MNIIKLHHMKGSQRAIFVDADKIIGIYETWSAAGTFMWTTLDMQGLNYDGDGHYEVKETPDEIMKIITNHNPSVKDLLEEANVRMQDAFYKSFLEANKDGELISTDGGCITHYHLPEREDSDGLPI